MEGHDGGLGSPRRIFEASRLHTAIFRRTLADEWEAAQGVQANLYHPNAGGGYHIAEALGANELEMRVRRRCRRWETSIDSSWAKGSLPTQSRCWTKR